MQTGQIIRRGNTWYLRFYRKIIVDGKTVNRQTATKLARVSPEFPNPDAVRAAGLTGPILGPLNAGDTAPEAATPLLDFIEHIYLPEVRSELKPKTYDGYMDSLKVLKPHIGGIELRKVRTADIEDILKAVRAAKPRANSTMKHFKWFLSGVFRFAVRRGFITVNPVPDAKAPKGITTEETHACMFTETQTMLKALKEPTRTIILTAALTGLRIGELAGLKWDDIKGDELHISRQIQHGEVFETKTEDSKATIPLVATVKDALEKHRRQSRGEFIFTGNRDAKPIVVDNVKRRAIDPAFKKAGLSWHGWHSFRRGLATELKKLGVDDLIIARLLRHGGGSVTQVHYIKTVPKTAQEAMRKAERAFKLAK
jgi:integrase